MKLIDPPLWATSYETKYEGLTVEQIEKVKSVQPKLLSALNSTIEEYVGDFPSIDTAGLEDPAEHYPNLFEMTCEYYITSSTFSLDGNEITCSFCVELQEKDSPENQKYDCRDYHGLEVLLLIDTNDNINSDGVVSSWGS